MHRRTLNHNLVDLAAEQRALAAGALSSHRPPARAGAVVTRNARPFLEDENQGPVGSCQGHGLTTVVEWLIWQQFGVVVPLCRMYAYRRTQERDGITRDRGSSITNGARVAYEEGLPRELWWPYPGQYERRVPDEARAHCGEFRLSEQPVLLEEPDTVWGFLNAPNTGVLLMVRWCSALRDAGRVVDHVDRGGGLHAVALTGLRAECDDDGVNMLDLVNSHRWTWGDRGQTLVTMRALRGMFANGPCYGIGMRGVSPASRRLITHPETK